MKVTVKYRNDNDCNNMSKAELSAVRPIVILYKDSTFSTNRLKKDDIPLLMFYNCVYTIVKRFQCATLPTTIVDQIWNEIKPEQGKKPSNISFEWTIKPEVEFRTQRQYEASAIFAAVYFVLSINGNCNELENCLKDIKDKAAYNKDVIPYFEHFESYLEVVLKNNKDISETYQSNTSHAYDRFASNLFEQFQKRITDLSLPKKINECNLEIESEKLKQPLNDGYISLLDNYLSYCKRSISTKEEDMPVSNSNHIDVNHIISAAKEYYPNHYKVILEILLYVLHSNQYKDDIKLKLEGQLRILDSAEKNASNKIDLKKYPVHLNSTKGHKINFIRVINGLYELGYFKDATQNKITKQAVFENMGTITNVDLSNYDKDLSRSLTDSTALDKHLEIFQELENKMTEIFNSK